MARGNARWKSGHEALQELSPEEFAFWQASYRLDPWGDDWERISALAAVLVNEIRRSVPRTGEVQYEELDFMVPFRKRTDATKKAMRQALSNLTALEGLPQ